MSFARFSDGDVYVYLNTDGLFECCACTLSLSGQPPTGWCHLVETSAEMLAHLEAHRAVGDDVPDECLEELRADAEENDRRAAELREGRLRGGAVPPEVA